MAKKSSLGRGLSALIREQDEPSAVGAPGRNEGEPPVRHVPLDRIRKSSVQPRRAFAAEPLQELTDSIREHGILQPLWVRPVGDDFELIAGERRLRAAGEAGLREAPVRVMPASDETALQWALIENLQREDLNIVEEADGYRTLAVSFHLTQEQIAQRVGKARASVANALRMLDLGAEVRTLLANGRLSAGHAKALLGVPGNARQAALAEQVVRDGLSVRQLEKRIRKQSHAPRKPRAARSDLPADHLGHISDQLHQRFGTAVRIEPSRTYANGKKAKGFIEIDFFSNDDLDRILQLLGLDPH